MRKLILLSMVMVMCVASVGFAGPAKVETVFDNVAIATLNTAVSRVFAVKGVETFNAWIDTNGPQGSPNLDIVCQVSPDTTAANFTTPTTLSPIVSSFRDESPYVTSFSPANMGYMRFVAYGVGGDTSTINTTGTTITMKLYTRE